METTREDRRPERVTDHHDADLEESRRIRGAEVGADDERHTRDADEHPEQTRRDRTGRRRRSPARSPAPTSGTPAIRRPASELEMCCSAEPSATHGMAISTAAKATTQRHRPSTWRRSVRTSAIGNRTAAAMTVRPSTRVAGVISATAIRMNRYGMPQMTDMRANRISARRLMTA